MKTRMNAQSRDIVAAMIEAGSVPECCDLCGDDLAGNAYSPFATVCKSCADVVENDHWQCVRNSA